MKRLFHLIICAIIFISGTAESLRYPCTFLSDTSKKTYDEAILEIEVAYTQSFMRMVVLPDKEAYLSSALVDTIISKEANYRIGDDVLTDNFEETNVTYVYRITPEQYLDSYIVFSQFTDLKNKAINQIVIRKFDANGKRLWMATINASKNDAKTFFKLIASARKKLKFKEIHYVNDRPGADGKKTRTIFHDDKLRKHNPVGGGTPYNSRW